MKIIRGLVTFSVAMSAWLFPVSADASSLNKGEMTVGVGGGFASYNESGYAKVFFQYTFVPHVRIAPEIGYIFRHEDKTGFLASCDMEFPFRVAQGFYVYPLAGVTFNSWNYSYRSNANRFGGEAGVGMELYITGNLKLNIQGKYSFMSVSSGAFASLGIGYVF